MTSITTSGDESEGQAMRTVDTDLQWADPLDMPLEEHAPRRRRPPARSGPPSTHSQPPPVVPALTLLAAGAAIALSIAALVIAIIAFGTVPTDRPAPSTPATTQVADDVPAATPASVPVVGAPESQAESELVPESGSAEAPAQTERRRPYDCTVSPRHLDRCE